MITRRSLLAASTAMLATSALTGRARAQSLSDLETAGDRFDQLHSLQVMQGDEVIFERAFRGPGLDRLANIKSCSKSIVALLLGSAIDNGAVTGVEATLGEVAPALIPSGADPRVADITLEDLVTLRAGLERTSGGNYGEWVSSRNWVANALSRPIVAEPGGRMLYSTGSTHILGAALAEATGNSLLAQARAALGRPLGIDIPPWTRDPQGYYLGGNEMALTPRAMLRIAQVVRDGGRYNGTQVISESWMQASLRVRTRSPFSGMGYGYGWFLTDTGYVLARGYGGQVIAAHPDRGLAVALTSDPLRPARSGGYFGDIEALLNGPILALA
ncbi:serine hydrolase [Phaeobacter sp. 22II1-1F12B]|uniref:serine hydrolase domain-containing protein n=1 Tax=Phaeobacter sp. 22II1-1F12B TaxID=1317111 RepID=UPI000B52898E|nr:serine hydrolase [Phaeobacter sp. 22II1-1F12B]OWU75479.1 6-aminohexanoate hydrolase [Phaeobacter sp. 22II1-1F12B]